ncbi:DNA-directed RNA polymerase subunit omega [Flammeovirga pectinis]|uniref:DNA-directed RNA polymerase subunit omega n=1 Tax=Flammeovirga pectinis TaxID=2494373 RepID=A0A3Q9FP89_9BACT|nr:DNA-directed RNA polymerase subunit omega [Flammeovirga pectinis]AZQ62785.1 DNA-directed RNA polymerase subunit omega [Flammeovirga pectinis]
MPKASIVTRDLTDLTKETHNIYESIVIVGKRSRQISSRLKDELNAKLSEFATTVDNLEEVQENREQIEISRFYERMPKATSLAIEELLEDKIFFTKVEDNF